MVGIFQEYQALRFALAAIWTELEKDNPSEEDMRQIANEALELTKHHERPKDLTLDGTGLESWKQYREKYP